MAQKSAAERLFWMLGIERTDDVLDLGCGTGHLAQEIRVLTDGRVVGIDLSPEMIALAREAAPETIEFVTGDVHALDMPEAFDAILSNSAFQWFKDGEHALRNCYAALRPGGRMAMQAPARQEYCPQFVNAVARLGGDPRTAETWSRFRTPWTFYETGEEYGRLFEAAGFSVWRRRSRSCASTRPPSGRSRCSSRAPPPGTSIPSATTCRCRTATRTRRGSSSWTTFAPGRVAAVSWSSSSTACTCWRGSPDGEGRGVPERQ